MEKCFCPSLEHTWTIKIVTENQSHGDVPVDRSTKQKNVEEAETESPGQASGCNETYLSPEQTLHWGESESFRE